MLFELEVRKLTFSKQPTNSNSLISKSIDTFLKNNPKSYWPQFKLARMCARYTFFSLADEIYSRLATEATNSIFNMSTGDLSYRGWLEFMSVLCRAESRISHSRSKNVNELVNSLNESLSYHTRAQFMFKAVCTKSLAQACSNTPALENSLACFQTRYGELRSEQMKMFIHLVMSVMTFVSIPAPVFQFKSADKAARFGRVTQQMKFSANELHKLNLKYKELLSECFDADQHTINVLNMLVFTLF